MSVRRFIRDASSTRNEAGHAPGDKRADDDEDYEPEERFHRFLISSPSAVRFQVIRDFREWNERNE